MCRVSRRPVVQYNGATAEQVLKDIEIEVRRLIIEYQRRTLAAPPSNEAPIVATIPVSVEVPTTSEATPCGATEETVPPPRKKRMADILGTTVGSGEQADVPTVSETTPCRRTEETADSPVPSVKPAEAVEAPQPQPPQPMSAAQQLRSRVLALREARAERKWMKRYYKSLAFQVRCNVEPLEDLLDYLHERSN